MLRRGIPQLLAAIVTVCATPAAVAQSGGLTIVVTAEDGEPLPGATVTISHVTGSVNTTSELTDRRGQIQFPVLAPGGGYSVRVEFSGLTTVQLDDLRVKLSQNVRLPVRLVSRFHEQVSVTARPDVIELEKTETSTRFTDDFIADLPVPGRFYQNILTMAPGVQDADGDGNPNVHGSRSRDFQALVGNVSNVDPLTGQWMSRVNPNSIEEMEIITAGAGVEFGRAQGGFARIIQKQGGNVHEGVLEYYLQDSRFDGSRAGDPSWAGSPEFKTVQPLFQVTGPVVRDRLWYRVSYEQRDREEPINVGTAIALYREDTETRDVQITWQVTPRNKLALQYRSDPWNKTNFGISNLVSTESSRRLDRGVDTFSLTWTAPQSPRTLVQTTVAWQDLHPAERPSTVGAPNTCVPESREPFLQLAQCIDLRNNLTSGSYYRSDEDRRQRMTLKSQATTYAGRRWGASHQFKVGLNVENERYFRKLTRGPTITFDEIEPELVTIPGSIPEAQPFGLALARLAVPETDDVRATGTNWAFYVEDQLRPRSDMSITLGVRVDREELNSEGRTPFDPVAERRGFESDPRSTNQDLVGFAWPEYFTAYEGFNEFESQLQALLCGGASPDIIGNCYIDVSESINSQSQRELHRKRRADPINIGNTNFSPFVALAWSPTGDARTAIKFSAGRHYNNIALVVPLQELEPIRTDVEYRVSLETYQTEIGKSINPALNTLSVDHDLRTPYQDELTATLERELWPETSIHLTYIDRRYRDQLQDTNLNIDVGDYGSCIPPGILFLVSPMVPQPGGGVGSGKMILDPYSGELYEDTDPGVGDGRIDDCAGVLEFSDTGVTSDPFGRDVVRLPRPDGKTDLYLQNPFWGDVLRVGNYNEIDYRGFVIEIVRRQYRGWEMNGSYTWSRARGDGEDFFQELGNDPSLRSSVRGYQSYDQRHVVKLNATTITPWGIRLGTALSWQSGLPYSLLRQQPSLDTLPPTTAVFGNQGLRLRQNYVTGIRNDQRNRSFWDVDVKATRELTLPREVNLQLSVEVFNLFDDETYTVWNTFTEEGVQLNGSNEAFRRVGREWQLGVRLSF